jgi:hypothetical protein
VWATVPLILVLARVVSAAPRRLAVVPTVALLVVFVAAIYNRNYSDEHRVEAVDEALADIAASDHPDAPVMTMPGIELVVQLYRDEPAIIIPSYFGPDDLPRAMDTVSTAAGGGPVWIIYTRPFDHDRNGVVRDALRLRGAVTYSTHAGVELIYLDEIDP